MNKDLKMPKALVLGASGFIGSALIRQLSESGYKISCLTHHSLVPSDVRPDLTYRGSLQTFNWHRLQAHMPDAIFHLARIQGQKRSGRYLAALQSNLANRRLLHWLFEQLHPPRLIYVGGTLAYGSHYDQEVTEDAKLSPAGFARANHIGERPVLRALGEQRSPIQFMRAAWVYGAGSWFKSFYLRPMSEQDLINIYGDGSNWMSLIHVQDCAGLIRFYAESGPENSIFNLFNGKPLRQTEFVHLLKEIHPELSLRTIPPDVLRKCYGKVLAEAFTFSLRVGSKHTNLHSRYAFRFPDHRKGLASVIEQYREEKKSL